MVCWETRRTGVVCWEKERTEGTDIVHWGMEKIEYWKTELSDEDF